MTQRIHFIGIGGSGLSAIARLLLEAGWVVSGSDRQESPTLATLRGLGARVTSGHAAENIGDAELVVRSSAVTDENPEVAAALAAGIPVLKRNQFLPMLTAGKKVIAVAGTHGKTTITSMIACTLTDAGLDPSYIIGAVPRDLGSNAHAGSGDWFVIEADEYDRMFLGLHPQIAVVSTLEHDHPDCFPTMDDYRAAFRAFVGQVQSGGWAVLSQDHLETAQLATSLPGGVSLLTCGLDPTAELTGEALASHETGGFSLDVLRSGDFKTHLNLTVPGRHNAANALSALGACLAAGLDADLAAESLSRYSGSSRRFDLTAQVNGITLIDDYAHHPTEIRATLAAARSRYPAARIWAIWQPHTFTRTLSLLDRFAEAFGDADQVVVTDIYGARESGALLNAADLAARIEHPSARHIAGMDAIVEFLDFSLQPGDVVLVLSAGDAIQINPLLARQLACGEGSA